MSRIHYKCRLHFRSMFRAGTDNTRILERAIHDRNAIRVFRSTELIRVRAGAFGEGTTTNVRVYGFFKIENTAAIESTIRPLYSEDPDVPSELFVSTFLYDRTRDGDGNLDGDVIAAEWWESWAPPTPFVPGAQVRRAVRRQVFTPCFVSGDNQHGAYIERNTDGLPSTHDSNGPDGFLRTMPGSTVDRVEASYEPIGWFGDGAVGDFCLDHVPASV